MTGMSNFSDSEVYLRTDGCTERENGGYHESYLIYIYIFSNDALQFRMTTELLYILLCSQDCRLPTAPALNSHLWVSRGGSNSAIFQASSFAFLPSAAFTFDTSSSQPPKVNRRHKCLKVLTLHDTKQNVLDRHGSS